MNAKYVAIMIWIILCRVIFFFLQKGTHHDLYYLQINIFNYITTLASFGMLMGMIYDKLSPCAKTFCKWFYGYLATFSVMMLFVLIPADWATAHHLDFNLIWYIYNTVWVVICAALIVYYWYCLKGKLFE